MSSARHSIGVRFARASASEIELLLSARRAARGRAPARRDCAPRRPPRCLVADQAAHHRHGARGIEHVHDRLRCNAGAIFTAVCALLVVAPPMSSGSLNPSRSISRATCDHLIERRRDQPAQADDIDLLLARRREDFFARHHHAEIDDLVVVAAEHHADDVLADVVHVALDRGHEHLALRAHFAAAASVAAFSASM